MHLHPLWYWVMRLAFLVYDCGLILYNIQYKGIVAKSDVSNDYGGFMSTLKKYIQGKNYRNMGNELSIKSLEKKLSKYKGEYLLRHRGSSAEELDKILNEEIGKRKAASIQICREANFNKELEIRNMQEKIDTLNSKDSESKFMLNYQIAQTKSFNQHLTILELEQKISILRSSLL